MLDCFSLGKPPQNLVENGDEFAWRRDRNGLIVPNCPKSAVAGDEILCAASNRGGENHVIFLVLSDAMNCRDGNHNRPFSSEEAKRPIGFVSSKPVPKPRIVPRADDTIEDMLRHDQWELVVEPSIDEL